MLINSLNIFIIGGEIWRRSLNLGTFIEWPGKAEVSDKVRDMYNRIMEISTLRFCWQRKSIKFSVFKERY